ncbi:hypothetical protein BGZ82_010878 [Podila clonocystis]|nr:hypothetical protein BGZ82_010878 [Podila clonocystis]
MAYQEQALREHDAREQGAASGSQFYMFQYAPPPGASPPMGLTYNPHGRRGSAHHPSLHAPLPESPMSMVPPPQAHMYPPMSTTTNTTTIGQRQHDSAPQGSTYTQDGPNTDELSTPPPPYTSQAPK